MPLNATCFLILPVNSPAYQEIKLQHREYTAIGVRGHGCEFSIPNWIQIEGTASVVVTVEGAGWGFASFEVIK